MKDGAVGLQKVPFTGGTLQLAPQTATRMAVGPQVAQPQPATIATAGMGTEVLRGVHRAGTPVGWGPRLGGHWRRRLRMGGFSFTQGTRGLGGQAGKRFGLVGACA